MVVVVVVVMAVVMPEKRGKKSTIDFQAPQEPGYKARRMMYKAALE